MVKPEKLHALTSLRFFAAACIVLHHATEHFHFWNGISAVFPLYQTVSFFFVLSGFILAYVYEDLQEPGALRRFFIARVARIWPLHAVTLGITLAVFFSWYRHVAAAPGGVNLFWVPLLANLFMAQSWFPSETIYYSFNAVSWSISTEFGFYLLFPLMLKAFRTNGMFRLGVMACAVFAAVVIVHVTASANVFPDSGTVFGIICCNPLMRSFEFAAGIVTAGLYRRLKSIYTPGAVRSTLTEILALGMVIVLMAANRPIQSVILPVFGDAGALWVDIGGINVPFVSLFILVMALGRGWIARIMRFRILIYLGDISFSVYLVHQILLRCYTGYVEALFPAPLWMNLIGFTLVVLAASGFLYEAVEKPSRRILVAWGSRERLKRSGGLKSMMGSGLRGAGYLALLTVLLCPLISRMSAPSGIRRITEAEARHIASNGYDDVKDIDYGAGFRLKGVRHEIHSGKEMLTLVWESLETVGLTYRVAVHFLDEKKNIISQADFNQSDHEDSPETVSGHTFWVNRIELTSIPGTVTSIGLALFDETSRNVLPVSRGPRDWNNTRLIIPFENLSR